MKTRLITTITVAATLALTACGSDDDTSADDATPDTGAAEVTVVDDAAPSTDATTDDTEAPATAEGLVATGSTDIGDVLVDADGLTLYGFTPDVDRTPTCFGGCAEAWPPILVDGPDLPAGLDPAVFSVTEREGDGHQLVAGDWPLYLFAGDVAAGDVNGQGSGGNWFAVAPDGSLIGA